MPAKIIIVGLGPGDPGLLTQRAVEVLSGAEEVHLRTGLHPIAAQLPGKASVHTFDHLYEAGEDFEGVYQAIIGRVLDLASRPQGVVYAVPGDPMVGEATVQALLRQAAEGGLSTEVVHGVSFVEPCLAALELDALDGLYVADALEVASRNHPPFPPDSVVLIGQLYSPTVASDVKLTLMNQYPDDHPVVLIHAAGTPQAQVERLPLYEIDRRTSLAALTTLYVPPLDRASAFESFQETVAHLRAPDGCPWDREQTPRSLRPHLLGEAYEALHALDSEDPHALKEELGDLLLQIVLQAQIATESGEFSMAQVIAAINDKIVRRHPHVFGDLDVAEVDQVLHNWEALKAGERGDHDREGVLNGVPPSLPALSQAQEIQARVARVGFDWPDASGVRAKIDEELGEVAHAADEQAQEAEIGDLLFAVVNYARWLGVDAEDALREASTRFRRRFAALEEDAQRQGRRLDEMTIDELEALWQVAKKGDKPRR